VLVSLVVPSFDGVSSGGFRSSSAVVSGLVCEFVEEVCEDLGGGPVATELPPVFGLSPVPDVVLSRAPAFPDEGAVPGDDDPPSVLELALLSALRRFWTAEPALCCVLLP
jgi:hypothetical protein